MTYAFDIIRITLLPIFPLQSTTTLRVLNISKFLSSLQSPIHVLSRERGIHVSETVQYTTVHRAGFTWTFSQTYLTGPQQSEWVLPRPIVFGSNEN